MPTATFPGRLRNTAERLPTHAYAAPGRSIERSHAPHAKDLAVLAVSFVFLADGAAWLYRKDTLEE